MKKISYITILFFIGICGVFAAEGDTIIVQTHNEVHLDWYEAYDDTAHFPDDSNTYRKIIMEFALGKYNCPISAEYCADWDYDVHILVQTEEEDWIELGRVITPYANKSYPRTPATWKHAYAFDVTDYYPILKNDVPVRIFYAGYSGGFTGTVRFKMIEGTPPRDVVKIDALWEGGFPYGNSENPINNNIGTKTLTMPTDATSAEMKMFITGHGGDNTENCAEFCKKWYKFMLNGQAQGQTDIWRDDCGNNFLYPQSGTWVYDRGNWCPGDLVHVNIHKIPSSVTPGEEFDISLLFQAYSSPANEATYKIGASMVYYKDFNRSLDAGIEEIISPNIDETYYRHNPICGSPVIKVKNFGSETISSIKFQYGVTNGTMETYTLETALLSLQEAEVSLPALTDLMEFNGIHEFSVQILEVNGEEDDEILNNELRSSFEAAPKWEGGNFYVDFKMSGSIQGYINRVNWKIKDYDGNILFNRNGIEASENYLDTVLLDNGCYTFEVDASEIGYGLNFFNSFTRGYIRIYNLLDGQKIPLPKTDLNKASLEGNFGNGFIQNFTVVNSVAQLDDFEKTPFQLSVYPNPATDRLFVKVDGITDLSSRIEIKNMLGQTVIDHQFIGNETEFLLNDISFGVYTLIFYNNGKKETKKVVISK